MKPAMPNIPETIFAAIGQQKGAFIAIGCFILLMLILQIAFRRLLPRIKGAVGERRVNKAVRALGLVHAHDVYLPHAGKATQVDHLVLAGSTIVVLETKNYDGAIYGTETDKQWTVAYSPRRKHRMQNPLHQNAMHARAVQAVSGEGIDVKGIVVSVGRAKFQNGRPRGICDVAQLKTILRKMRGPTSPEAAAAWKRLTDVHSNDRKTMKAAHSERIKDRRAMKGGKLVRRSAAGREVDARRNRIEPKL